MSEIIRTGISQGWTTTACPGITASMSESYLKGT